ncbi:MAG TPA: hypothetical protein VMW36_00535 [Patescibacteria group bacterium]|nr:hypothetical protein [Patescibacteria group bacterium]
MTKEEMKSWIKKIEKRIVAIEKERDKLDGMISELSDLRDIEDSARYYLEEARDALSQLV